jgi:hypothetical protein
VTTIDPSDAIVERRSSETRPSRSNSRSNRRKHGNHGHSLEPCGEPANLSTRRCSAVIAMSESGGQGPSKRDQHLGLSGNLIALFQYLREVRAK